MMQINININNKTIPLIIEQNDTIYSAKIKIQYKLKIDAKSVLLIYNNKILEDENTFDYYGINEESKLCFFLTFLLPINLVIRVRTSHLKKILDAKL